MRLLITGIIVISYIILLLSDLAETVQKTTDPSISSHNVRPSWISLY